jgi:hypothetical protein
MLDLLEHAFDSAAVETLEHWFNGRSGPAAQRDIWLRHNPAGPLWEIEARQAGQTAFAEYGSERAARRVLNRMLAGDSTDWRQLPR